MSKELTPLEALSIMYFNCREYDNLDKHYDVIEKSLKEGEEAKQMIRNFNKMMGEPSIIEPSIEKKLKALEIIKKYFFIEDFQDFISLNGRLNKENKEEYDLLKEVLL